MKNAEQTQTAGELAVQSDADAMGEGGRGKIRFTNEQLIAAQITGSTALPSIKSAQAAPVPLSVDFWSPQAFGEQKRGWILGIEWMDVPQKNFETGEITGMAEMECVLFVEETPTGMKSRWYTSAKLLVSYVKAAISRGEIVPSSLLTPVQITYKSTKTAKNGRKLSDWEILPLIVSEG